MIDKVEVAPWGEMVLEVSVFVLGGLVIALMLTTMMLGDVRPSERHAGKDKPSKVEVVERRADRPKQDGAKQPASGPSR